MNRIKSLRLKNKLTQTELAKYLNVAQNTISYWEQGKYDIDNESLTKLADLFRCSTDYLLGRETKNPVTENDDGKSENIIVIHRNGKRHVYHLSKEKLDALKPSLEELDSMDEPNL